MNTAAEPAGARASTVLALNTGSSSLKFGLFRVGAKEATCLLEGAHECTSVDGHAEAMRKVVATLAASALPRPEAIGHRVVHGGPTLQRHVLIDASVLPHLEAAAAFAPLHAPAGLAAIRSAQREFAGTPQVACLDTVFHAGLPEVSRTLPIARELQTEGIRRYGFHGLSCESIVRQLGPDLPERLVVAHLGGGASITAIRNGRAVDTSMGLTPTGGMPMATRSGDLDPGLLIYLMREKGLDASALDELVNRRSGLLGVSGTSGDMRRLHAAAAASDADAALAIEMFCVAVRKQIAAMAAVLGGIDLLVFTGGIGEHDAGMRDSVCAALAWVGGMRVQVLPSLEQVQIARHAWAITTAAGQDGTGFLASPAEPVRH